jgi:hypothetical protein
MAGTTEDKKHAAGGPGKAAKEGHIDPDKRNAPSQNQHGAKVATKGPRNAEPGLKAACLYPALVGIEIGLDGRADLGKGGTDFVRYQGRRGAMPAMGEAGYVRFQPL